MLDVNKLKIGDEIIHTGNITDKEGNRYSVKYIGDTVVILQRDDDESVVTRMHIEDSYTKAPFTKIVEVDFWVNIYDGYCISYPNELTANENKSTDRLDCINIANKYIREI